MLEGFGSIMKNDVWEVALRLEDKFVVGSCWVDKIKHGVDGSIEKYKARFVAKGFSQVEVIDYDKTFAVVAKICLTRLL